MYHTDTCVDNVLHDYNGEAKTIGHWRHDVFSAGVEKIYRTFTCDSISDNCVYYNSSTVRTFHIPFWFLLCPHSIPSIPT